MPSVIDTVLCMSEAEIADNAADTVIEEPDPHYMDIGTAEDTSRSHYEPNTGIGFTLTDAGNAFQELCQCAML